jgi:hypothetical protein
MSLCPNSTSHYTTLPLRLRRNTIVATVGLSLTIPIAYAIDLLVMHAPGAGSLLGGIGALVTLLGFGFVNR